MEASQSVRFGWTFDTGIEYTQAQDQAFIDALTDNFAQWNSSFNGSACLPGSCTDLLVTVGRDPDSDGTAVELSVTGVR